MKISALQVFPNYHECKNCLRLLICLVSIISMSVFVSSMRKCSLQEVLNGCKILEELIVIIKGPIVLVLPKDKEIYSTLCEK